MELTILHLWSRASSCLQVVRHPGRYVGLSFVEDSRVVSQARFQVFLEFSCPLRIAEAYLIDLDYLTLVLYRLGLASFCQ